MPRAIPRTDVLVTIMGAPHADDTVTTALRLVQAALERGGSVQVWTCGYATLLTQRGLGEHKPRNLAAWETEYPTTATVVADLLAAYPDTLHWYGCRFCSDDRGAVDHLPQVVLRPPARYADNVVAAAKTVLVGVM
jgi:sulfur relay (sulfurtransferase) complex TusBCD TusD component (DsrE family)